VNYILSILWIFTTTRKIKKRHLEFIYFSIIGVIGLILNDIFLYYLTSNIHIYYILSEILATVIVYLWNFFARKYFMFN
ncbi:MAG: GtrA family protein, partial [Patescibacteria group bacterium]